MDHVECVVAGAGVVGLAVARALARSGREVLCLEAAHDLGAGTTGRGSGVIHAGLYYPPGSLKARLCLAGRDMLYAYAESRNVPSVRRGKLVVATTADEDDELVRIAARAEGNGVDDLQRLGSAEARRLEPALACSSALLSPSTGVVDARALLAALRGDMEDCDGMIAFRAPLEEGHVGRGGFDLAIGGATPMRLSCHVLVNAAGHGAPRLARAVDGLDARRVPQQFYAKGNYFDCIVPVPFTRLIYPLPVPGGIGTHLTIDTDGHARFGPDVEWVDAAGTYDVDPARAAGFAADVRRWWPAMPDDSLRADRAGIRPKIAGPGEPARDFVIEGECDHGVAGLVNLFGIESPGLTAALAIAEHVMGLLPA